ncbi:ribose 5-phosphate isomerase B [Vibrio hannami]|uniref:ribose 5-phosphate isomerase B n=1 Tax=Vibrio hannami TaxID=2717094 RepID=UPI00240FCC62|nr:ribose 5-phosphate isomerase B [Vibrio hannami]MDG3086323.1 ribose 5-phosphate isomerase B [Vibrio hannami]
MKIAIGSDHSGFTLKQYIYEHLGSQRHNVFDTGTNDQARTHSALYATAVCSMVNTGEADLGILICGTGVGMSICANKINGIRAVLGADIYTVKQSKEHNNTNVLTLGALTTSPEKAVELVEIWLNSSFDETDIRKYRLQLIEEIEKKQR